MDIIHLNGKQYALDDEMRIRTIDPWPEVLRTTGNRQRIDRINTDAWNQESFRAGIGFFKTIGPVPVDESVAHISYLGYADGQVETRWEGIVTPAALPAVISHTNDGTSSQPDHEYYRFFLAGASGFTIPALYVMSSNINESIALLAANGSNFGEGKDLTTGFTGYRPTCISEEGGVTKIWGGTLGSSIHTKITSITALGAFADFTPTTNLSHIPYSMVNFQDILYAATIEKNPNELQIEKSTDGGDNWANVTGLTRQLYGADNASAGHTAELIIYYDADGNEALYCVTNQYYPGCLSMLH